MRSVHQPAVGHDCSFDYQKEWREQEAARLQAMKDCDGSGHARFYESFNSGFNGFG